MKQLKLGSKWIADVATPQPHEIDVVWVRIRCVTVDTGVALLNRDNTVENYDESKHYSIATTSNNACKFDVDVTDGMFIRMREKTYPFRLLDFDVAAGVKYIDVYNWDGYTIFS